MIQQIFTTLSRGVEASPPIALTAALVWGILSIILSPCHLASIPLIIGLIDNHPNMSTRRAFTISLLFAFGILISIALIGAITALAGRMLGDIGSYGNYFVALIFILVGLNLLGVFPIPFAAPAKLASKRKGTFAAFMLGLIFGIALGPCTFAYMAPIIAVTNSAAPYVRHGPLLCNRPGRNLDPTRTAIHELEREISRNNTHQKNLCNTDNHRCVIHDLQGSITNTATTGNMTGLFK